MTLQQIADCRRDFITPAEAAEVLGANPHCIRIAARDNPRMLGFPVVRIGNRTKIPRIPFLEFMGWRER